MSATARDSEQFFDAIASRYDRAYAPEAEDSRRRMARVLRDLPGPPARVLDLGVGTGRELSALLDAGYAPTGVDLSQSMLDKCARRARPVPLFRADFWPPRSARDDERDASPVLSFEAAYFDAALALHGTLAHPPDSDAPHRLAAELARLVRRGGRFIAEVPSERWLDSLQDAAVSRPAGAQDGGGAPKSRSGTAGTRRGEGAEGERRVKRTGSRTCVYQDLVVGVSVAATVLSRAEWEAALEPFGPTSLEPLGDLEWLIVAERR